MTEFLQLTRFLQHSICIINKSFMCHSFDFYSFVGDFRLNSMQCIWSFQLSVTCLLLQKDKLKSITNVSHHFKINDKETHAIISTKHCIVFMCIFFLTGVCISQMLQVDTEMGVLVQRWWLPSSSQWTYKTHWQNWHFPCFSENTGSVQYFRERNNFMYCYSVVEGVSWEQSKTTL